MCRATAALLHQPFTLSSHFFCSFRLFSLFATLPLSLPSFLPCRYNTLNIIPRTKDEAVAERMLEKVESFIREAREGDGKSDNNDDGTGKGGGGGSTAGEQAPLELEVLYDDSWLDEMACGLFLVIALALMTRPYVEVCLI